PVRVADPLETAEFARSQPLAQKHGRAQVASGGGNGHQRKLSQMFKGRRIDPGGRGPVVCGSAGGKPTTGGPPIVQSTTARPAAKALILTIPAGFARTAGPRRDLESGNHIS